MIVKGEFLVVFLGMVRLVMVHVVMINELMGLMHSWGLEHMLVRMIESVKLFIPMRRAICMVIDMVWCMVVLERVSKMMIFMRHGRVVVLVEFSRFSSARMV